MTGRPRNGRAASCAAVPRPCARIGRQGLPLVRHRGPAVAMAATAGGSEVVVSIRVAQGVLGGRAVAGNEPVQGVGEDAD